MKPVMISIIFCYEAHIVLTMFIAKTHSDSSTRVRMGAIRSMLISHRKPWEGFQYRFNFVASVVLDTTS